MTDEEKTAERSYQMHSESGEAMGDRTPEGGPTVSNEAAGGGKSEQQAEPAPSEVEELRAQLARTQQELADLKDKYMRALAEAENSRRRIRQQAEEEIRRERERLLKELLPIIDDLERTVLHARGGGNGEPLVKGAELVLKSAHDFLRRFEVTQFSATGEPFNPELHEAIEHTESAEHAPNTVIREHQTGYRIGNRLLRPALVSVAKPSSSTKTAASASPDSASPAASHLTTSDSDRSDNGGGDVESS